MDEELTIKAEVLDLFGNSYKQQDFDTKFKELWEYNWNPIRKEVHADIIVFVNDEAAWADEDKNKGWGDVCREKALSRVEKYI